MRASSRGRLADLYVSYATPAKKLAYLLTGDLGLAEDLTQEAFIRLAGRFAQFRSPEAFDAYLRQTVVNLARSSFRRRRVERRYLDGIHAEEGGCAFEEAVTTSDLVRRALMTLSYRERAALVLRFFNGLSVQEIAGVMDVAPGTVKSLLSRGSTKLRERLGSGGGG